MISTTSTEAPSKPGGSDDSDAIIRERLHMIGVYYDSLVRLNAGAQLFYKVDDEVRNLAYLVTLDGTTDLSPQPNLVSTPEERARRFLTEHFQLFSFPGTEMSEQKFDSRLFLKHSMRSMMGVHCIFGWRIGGVEALDYNFVVHLDRTNRIVMVSSVYRPGIEPQPFNMDAIFKQLNQRLQRVHAITSPIVEPVIIWYDGAYTYCLQVKFTNRSGDNIWFIDTDGRVIRQYSDACKSSPAGIGLATIFRDMPTPSLGASSTPDQAFGAARPIQHAVLRGLNSARDLVGRYVAVVDQISAELFDTRKAQFLASPDLITEKNTQFDRQMTYYHIDYIQRYLRDIGLDLLDDYEHINPIQVVLYPKQGELQIDTPLYASQQQRIYMTELADGCTSARDPRILYHEFMHAVTDAFARLNRQAKVGPGVLRAALIWQAAAMDEGLADYFACSLAVRAGADNAFFYAPPAISSIPMPAAAGTLLTIGAPRPHKLQLSWRQAGRVRRLGGARPDYPPIEGYQLNIDQSVLSANVDLPAVERQIYLWGEQWGQYLWHLRSVLGVEIADTIIAHSILFLTRWSTFGQGVLAIALADSLLFDGRHQADILRLGNTAADWQSAATLRNQAAGDASLAANEVGLTTYTDAPAPKTAE
jgi:hypothetical protein